MKPDYYTFTGQHPDDAINKVKVFINELQKVQEHYFKELLNGLGITEELDDRLFDYIYNEEPDVELMFTEYLEDVNIKYEDFVKKN